MATTTQNINLSVTVDYGLGTEDLENNIKSAIVSMMAISKNRPLNELTHADIIYCVKSSISAVRNVKVLSPATDIVSHLVDLYRQCKG